MICQVPSAIAARRQSTLVPASQSACDKGVPSFASLTPKHCVLVLARSVKGPLLSVPLKLTFHSW
jgi:hypothetical protein